jgi:hypothetical protein
VLDRAQFDRQKPGFTAYADPRMPGFPKDERRRRRDPKFAAVTKSKRRGAR